jgi:hypothetical protein
MHCGKPGAWFEVTIVGTTCWNSYDIVRKRGYEESYMDLHEPAQLSSVL